MSRIDISNEIVYYVHVFLDSNLVFLDICICSVNMILWYTDCLFVWVVGGLFGLIQVYGNPLF